MREFQMQAPPALPELPDFITTHFDPFSGDDDTADFDGGTAGLVSTRMVPRQIPMPDGGEAGDPATWAGNVSRNAPCPCGSGQKYKHCHGQIC